MPCKNTGTSAEQSAMRTNAWETLQHPCCALTGITRAIVEASPFGAVAEGYLAWSGPQLEQPVSPTCGYERLCGVQGHGLHAHLVHLTALTNQLTCSSIA